KAGSLSRGEWVAFCDQDDVWLSNKLQVAARQIRRHPRVLLVTHPAILVTEELRPTGEIAWPSSNRRYPRLSLSPWRSGMGCGQVFRSFLVREIPYSSRFIVDTATGRKAPHDDWILKIS